MHIYEIYGANGANSPSEFFLNIMTPPLYIKKNKDRHVRHAAGPFTVDTARETNNPTTS